MRASTALRASAIFAATAALPACPDRSVAKVPISPSTVVVKDLVASPDVDILFVIDNSSSTNDKQALFAANFGNFVTALSRFPSGLPNVHVGVVDTTVDIGATGYAGCPSPNPVDDGRLQSPAGCLATGARFLIDLANPKAGGRTQNYSTDFATAFGCLAKVGAAGCGFEAPLEAMKRALDPARTENAGFVRDGAFLAIVFLTDEDDASTRDPAVFSLPDDQVGGASDFRVQPLFAYTCDQPISPSAPGSYANCRPRTDSYLAPVDGYVQFLAGVKAPAQTVVAVIASPPPGLATNDSPPQRANTNPDAIATGPLTLNGRTQPMALQPSTTCTIAGATAIGRPALRLASFLASYGARGKFYNVCQADYSGALADIGNTLFGEISPCLPKQVDIPLDCSVTDIQNRGAPSQTEQLVPACGADIAASPRPCWHAQPNATLCDVSTSGYELVVERGETPPTGTITEVQCAESSP